MLSEKVDPSSSNPVDVSRERESHAPNDEGEKRGGEREKGASYSMTVKFRLQPSTVPFRSAHITRVLLQFYDDNDLYWHPLQDGAATNICLACLS